MSSGGEASEICLYILAFVFPPAAVGVATGCSGHLLLNILLSILWLPGIIHACIIVARESRKERERLSAGQQVYVAQGHGQGQGAYPPHQQQQQGYQQQGQAFGGQQAAHKV